ncbi:MAG: DPP IV N-terminal domain-containing protein [Bacteroidales bacterium]|nr:DPP IV N-terminal domain-containing protein [Bacteroidales bacterium]
MRRSIYTAAAAAFLSMGLYAQDIPGAFASRQANDQSGRILTMEETILSRDLYPRSERFRWQKDGKTYKAVKASEAVQPQRRNAYEAFTEGNGLYMRDTLGNVTAIAEDCDRNIVYGQSVSRNEFGIDGGIFWSPDRSRLAFYRKDESAVTDFPLLDIRTRTGELKPLKYPMAGMASEVLRLCVYDMASGDTLHVKANDFGHDRYLTNITWSPDSRSIFIQVLDRSQKHMRLNMYDASTGDFVKTILSEDNSNYVEPLDPLYFIDGSNSRFIYRTANRDGFRNLYLCDTDGAIQRLTATDADVEYIGNDGKDVYYTSAEVSPVENHFFKINIKTGKKTRLTYAEGWHTVFPSPDYRLFIDHYTSIANPGVTDLCTTDGKKRENLHKCEDPTMDYAYSKIMLGSVKSADGKYDNYYRLILPKDFDPSRKYPMVLYVYGGPHSQMVRNTYMAELRRWEMYMAQRGYIVYVQDNRGTQNRGLDFEQAIHGQCGQAEMADQIEGIRMMAELPFVDRDRIGVHGWSYGGFMTISLVTNYPDIFKVAVAGGPVIDWKWYEVMYGERYMDSPSVNQEGYEKVSLINKAKDLKGKLLICQGAVDPVVVWQHSLSFVQECINNNVQVDYFPYPTAEHNMFGRERVHLYDKVSEYFDTWL